LVYPVLYPVEVDGGPILLRPMKDEYKLGQQCKNVLVNKASLWKSLRNRGLTTLKSPFWARSSSRVLTLVTSARRASVTGALPTSYTFFLNSCQYTRRRQGKLSSDILLGSSRR
jgi:hypothetical protein